MNGDQILEKSADKMDWNILKDKNVVMKINIENEKFIGASF